MNNDKSKNRSLMIWLDDFKIYQWLKQFFFGVASVIKTIMTNDVGGVGDVVIHPFTHGFFLTWYAGVVGLSYTAASTIFVNPPLLIVVACVVVLPVLVPAFMMAVSYLLKGFFPQLEAVGESARSYLESYRSKNWLSYVYHMLPAVIIWTAIVITSMWLLLGFLAIQFAAYSAKNIFLAFANAFENASDWISEHAFSNKLIRQMQLDHLLVNLTESIASVFLVLYAAVNFVFNGVRAAREFGDQLDLLDGGYRFWAAEMHPEHDRLIKVSSVEVGDVLKSRGHTSQETAFHGFWVDGDRVGRITIVDDGYRNHFDWDIEKWSDATPIEINDLARYPEILSKISTPLTTDEQGVFRAITNNEMVKRNLMIKSAPYSPQRWDKSAPCDGSSPSESRYVRGDVPRAPELIDVILSARANHRLARLLRQHYKTAVSQLAPSPHCFHQTGYAI